MGSKVSSQEVSTSNEKISATQFNTARFARSKIHVKLWMGKIQNSSDFLLWGILCFPEWQPDVNHFFSSTPSSIDVDNASASSAHLTHLLYVCEVVVSAFSKFIVLRDQNENVQTLFIQLTNLQKIKKVTIIAPPPSPDEDPNAPKPKKEDVEKEKIKDEYAGQKIELEKCKTLINSIFKLSKDLKSMIEDGGVVCRKTD